MINSPAAKQYLTEKRRKLREEIEALKATVARKEAELERVNGALQIPEE